MELPEEWLEKANFFLKEAKRHLEEGVYWIVCFESQQASEFYLKALLVALTGLNPYTHDLSELLKSLEDLGFEAPPELYAYADALTPHYTLARYPGRKPISYTREMAERCLSYAERIIGWIKEKVAEERVRK